MIFRECTAIERVDMVPTSSIAITTSTVSKLSRPKSFEKCEVFESFISDQSKKMANASIEVFLL